MSETETPERIDWRLAAPETGGEPERDPRKAYFHWHHGDSVIKTQDFTQEELEAQIRILEREGEAVPPAFRAALAAFEKGAP